MHVVIFIGSNSFYELFSDEDGFNGGPSFHGYYSSNVGISPNTSEVNLVSKSNLQDNSSIKRYLFEDCRIVEKGETTILVVITPTGLI